MKIKNQVKNHLVKHCDFYGFIGQLAVFFWVIITSKIFTDLIESSAVFNSFYLFGVAMTAVVILVGGVLLIAHLMKLLYREADKIKADTVK